MFVLFSYLLTCVQTTSDIIDTACTYFDVKYQSGYLQTIHNIVKSNFVHKAKQTQTVPPNNYSISQYYVMFTGWMSE